MSQRWKYRPPYSRSHTEVATAPPRALLVALLAALPPAAAAAAKTPKDERWCLLWAGTGCSSITTQELCLGSRDGRNWKGSPCTWCGEGTQCTGSRCQAAAQVKGTNLTLSQAACSNRTAEESEIDDPVLRRGALFEEVHTAGQPNIGQACRHNTVTDKKASYYWTFSASSLERCQDRCRSYDDCTGVQYDPSSEACEVWWKPIHWSMASKGQLCYRVAASALPGELEKPRSTYCLGSTMDIDGCSGIDEEQLCLSSRDGRKEGFINGSRIYDEPCVWCGGQACTSLNDNRCEPYDWLLQHTNDLAFSPHSSYFNNISVASCDEDVTSSSTTIDLAPPLSAEVAPSPPEVSVEFDSNTTTVAFGALSSDEELGNGYSFHFPWWGWVLGLLAFCAAVAALVAAFFRSGRSGGGGGKRPKARKKTRAIRQLEAESTDEITPMLQEASPADKDAAATDTEGPPEPPFAFPAMQPPLYQPSLFGPPPPPLSMQHAGGRGVGMLAGTHWQQQQPQQQQQQRYAPVSVVEMPMARAITPLHRLPPPMRAPTAAAEPLMPAPVQLF